MPFIIYLECPCCKQYLHHCFKCWHQFHLPKAQKVDDYTPPKFYGQSMISDEMKMALIKNKIEYATRITIKEDKNRPYVEGEYH